MPEKQAMLVVKRSSLKAVWWFTFILSGLTSHIVWSVEKGSCNLIVKDTDFAVPHGRHRLHVFVVGGGGVGCEEHRLGRGKSGEFATKTIDVLGPSTIKVIVGRGGLNISQSRGQATSFGTLVDAKGGEGCGNGTTSHQDIKGIDNFLLSIRRGSDGEDSVSGDLSVLGGEGGILINNTGPRAQRGGGDHSSEGGLGYGAAGGSGGVQRDSENISHAVGGAGANGVAYVEMVPVNPCPTPMYIIFAVEARKDPKEINLQLNLTLRMSRAINLTQSRIGLILYKGTAELKVPFRQFANLAELNYFISRVEYEGNVSLPVDFTVLYTDALTFYAAVPLKILKYFFVITYDGRIRSSNVLSAYILALSETLDVVTVATVISNKTGVVLKLQGLVNNQSNLFISTADALPFKIPEIADRLCPENTTTKKIRKVSPTTLPFSQSKLSTVITFTQQEDTSTETRKVPPATSMPSIQGLLQGASRLNISNPKEIQDFIDQAGKLISSGVVGSDAFQVIDAIEKGALAISKQLDPNGPDSIFFSTEDHGLELAAYAVDLTNMPELNLRRKLRAPLNGTEMGDNNVVLPRKAFVVEKGRSVGHAVWLIYKPPNVMNQLNDSSVDSRVMNVIVQPQSTSSFDTPVKLLFHVNKESPNTTDACVFWKKKKSSEETETGHGSWSTGGCHVASRDVTSVTCHCSHLTSFAVLTKVKDVKLPEEHQLALTIVTCIGCAISILGCIMTICVYLYLPSLRSQRTLIHLNLVIAILLAQSLFLVAAFAIKPNMSKIGCYSLAVGLYYFNLCVFLWMLSEGIHIYAMVIRVFNTGVAGKKRYYYVIGWVVPILLTMASAIAFRGKLVSDKVCWLSIDSGAIWAFAAPCMVIMLINLFILVRVMKVTAKMLEDECPSSTKSLLKAFVTLLPIMGLTWVFGFLAINEKTIVFEYLFTICSSLQGFLIFLMYCLGSTEVKREFKRKLQNTKARRNPSNSSASKNTPKSYALKALITKKDEKTRDSKCEAFEC